MSAALAVPIVQTKVGVADDSKAMAPLNTERSELGDKTRDCMHPLSGSRRNLVRHSTAQPGTSKSDFRKSSPQRIPMAANELDHKNIVVLSQSCTEDVDIKLREKSALAKLLSDLKKKKMQYDAKIAKKRREVDSTIVQTMEMEKKLQSIKSNNKMVESEVSGLRLENDRLTTEVDHLRRDLKEANASFDKECQEVEKLKQMLGTYRKELNIEMKARDNVQQDLRASRTAQNLMIDRVDEMEKRNRALKTCVADTFNH